MGRGGRAGTGGAMSAIERLLTGRVYYGWVMLVAVSVAQVVSWGILYYAFSVFVGPMSADLGWSSVAMTGAYSLALLSAGLAALPVGRWLDHHGPRALMSVGSCLAVALVLLWSRVDQLWAFYLIMGAIGVISAGVLYEPAFAMVAVWFRHQRGRALTVLTFFGAWASFIFIPLSDRLVAALGWRQALVALAAILAVVTVPVHVLLLRRRPEDMGLLPDGAAAPVAGGGPPPAPERSLTTGAAIRDVRFWGLTFAFAASAFATVAMTVHLIPYLVGRGHQPGFAASVAGLFGLMSLAGRMLIGPLADRFSRRWVTVGLMAMQLVGLVVLALAPGAPGALVYIALFGAGSGTLTIMRAALLAERYGPASYGTISGAQNLALTGVRTLAPIGVGAAAAALGGLAPVIGGLALLVTAGAVVLALERQ